MPLRFNRTHLLFLVIFLEGYVVLATELLSIRQLIPFVGSGTEVIAIIISAVLLPLAFGYQHGGSLKQRREKLPSKVRGHFSVRKILIRNLFTSQLILTFGLSYPIQEMLFSIMQLLGLHSIIVQTTIFCLLFLVTPTFLLAQTVPLVSHYFAKKQLSEMTGRMLGLSTAGSFFGSVFTTVVLMMTIGVHNTVIVVLACITFMIIMLERRALSFASVLPLLMLYIGYEMNNSKTMQGFNVVSNNSYNLVQHYTKPDATEILSVNRSASSTYNPQNGKKAEYIEWLEKRIIHPIAGQKKRILVIGSGGFTLGLEDNSNLYTYVDIDPDLKRVAETHFLPEKLGTNKQFVPMSARAFLEKTSDSYDFILMDVFTNAVSIPLECTTQEFFQAIRKRLNKDGIVAANIIARPDLSDKFSIRMDRTFASVFPAYSREVIQNYNAWSGETRLSHPSDKEKYYYANVLYTYYDRSTMRDDGIYTDDLTTYSIDRKQR